MENDDVKYKKKDFVNKIDPIFVDTEEEML
jgi:hypothetical protein